jgi:hypothetical protein
VIGSEMVIVLVVMLLLISAPLYLDWFTTYSGISQEYISPDQRDKFQRAIHQNDVYESSNNLHEKKTLNLKFGIPELNIG